MIGFSQIGGRHLRTHWIGWRRWLPLLMLALVASGCTSMLPTARNTTSSFVRFEDLRDAVQSVQPMRSDLDALVRLGIDPAKLPNTTVLSYADVLRRFAPGTVAIQDELAPGIVACLAARESCRGWELNVSQILRARTGNFFADFFRFRRHTVTSGWRFNALILMANDVVVYRAWGGQPLVNQVDIERNPLGPLQEIGPAIVRSPL